MATSTRTPTPATDPEGAKPNPRTARSHERLEQAKELITEELSGGSG